MKTQVWIAVCTYLLVAIVAGAQRREPDHVVFIRSDRPGNDIYEDELRVA